MCSRQTEGDKRGAQESRGVGDEYERQLQQTGKLQLGLGLVVLKNESNKGWMNSIPG